MHFSFLKQINPSYNRWKINQEKKEQVISKTFILVKFYAQLSRKPVEEYSYKVDFLSMIPKTKD